MATRTAKKPASVPAAQAARFVKLSDEGEHLSADAAEWSAVLDLRTDLIWSAGETDEMTWKQARAHCEQLELAGAKGCRLPTVEELFALADRSKHDPAIDGAFFPKCKSSWYWSSTPWAPAPSSAAWVVGFSDGHSSYDAQDYVHFVRAVRPRQAI